VHLSNIVVPKEILQLEEEIDKIKQSKNQVVKNQNFEEAARLRDLEKKLLSDLEIAKREWELKSQHTIYDVDENKISDVVAMMTGIPVNKVAESENEKLLKMDANLKALIIGQDEAVTKLTKAIRRTRAGLKDPKRPIGSFIFLGPTGVGKTEMAKVLAKYLFDSDEALIRIDMSEYMEKFSVSRLVGAPPGYVGYEEGGQLTEKVRRKPYAVVLLDEIEKAHPDVYNILLQVLDDGVLTDSLGHRVDFKNTILIMTSNIGARDIKGTKGFGFGEENVADKYKQMKSTIEDALKRVFNPEFLNRVDETIVFRQLDKMDIMKIIDIQTKELFKRMSSMNISIELNKQAKEFLSDKAYDPVFGARPLRRALQKYVEDPVAEEILKGTFGEGSVIKVTYNKKKDELRFIEGNPNKAGTEAAEATDEADDQITPTSSEPDGDVKREDVVYLPPGVKLKRSIRMYSDRPLFYNAHSCSEPTRSLSHSAGRDDVPTGARYHRALL
jgi:ATP-dependent Clp protease ATP-binding subunit ClpC